MRWMVSFRLSDIVLEYMFFIISIVLGIAMIGYGAFVAAARAGTLFYLIWIAMGTVLIVSGCAVKFEVIRLLPGWIVYIGLAVAGILAAIILFALVLVMSQFNSAGEKDADVVIVLGAQIIDDRPSKVLRKRLDTAAAYLKENVDTICIVSGGQGANEICPESKVMKDYLVSCGINESRIIEEDKSKNTSENIAFSKKLMPQDTDRVAVITSNFHLYRGLSIAKKANLPGLAGIAAPSSAPYLPNNVLRECLGIVKDFACGNI